MKERAQFLYDQPTFPSVRQSSLTMTNQPCKKVKTFSPFTYHVSSSVWKRLHYGYLNLINHQWTFNKKTWTPLLLMLLINLHISLRECNHLRKCFWNMQILHLIPENIEYHKCQLQYYYIFFPFKISILCILMKYGVTIILLTSSVQIPCSSLHQVYHHEQYWQSNHTLNAISDSPLVLARECNPSTPGSSQESSLRQR